MSYFGLHLQTPVNEWDSEILWAAEQGRPYKVIKTFWVEGGRIVKDLSPNTITVFRHWIAHQEPFLDRAIISSTEADAAADEFIMMFKDSVNQNGCIDYVESLNETYPTGNLLSQKKAVAFDRAFIRRLSVHCPETKPIVYTAPPGNIDHHEYEVLVPLALDCLDADGAFGYHNYWSVVNKHSYASSPQHAMDYHMRWAWSLDRYLVEEWGIRIKYMLGESGPIGAGPDGYWQKPNDGWLLHSVWDGDIDGYISDLKIMDGLFYDSVPGQEGRLIGATLFTSGYAGWDLFQVQHQLLGRVTDHIINYDSGPTPPPPYETFEEEAWRATSEMQENGQNGIRLNASAGLQTQISEDNIYYGLDLQVVTSETDVQGRIVQAAESLSGARPRRVYVWEPDKEIYYFEEP